MKTDHPSPLQHNPSRFTFHVSRLAKSAIRNPQFVIFLALAAFIPAIRSYFLSDDFVLLGWTHVGTPGEVAAFFDPHTFWFYRPLVKVYYWLGQSLFGLNPEPFHIFSILLHGANAYLVYYLASDVVKGQGSRVRGQEPDLSLASPIRNPQSAIRNRNRGLLAALIFLFIPYHAETVSWIAATGDLLAALGILSCLLLMRQYWRSGRAIYLLVSLLIFTFALFARETAVLLLPLLILDLLTVTMDGRRWTVDDGSTGTGSASTVHRLPSTVYRPSSTVALALYLLPFLLYIALQSGGGQVLTGRGGLSFHSLNVESVLLGVMQYVHGLIPGGSLLAQLPLDTQRVLVWVEIAVVLLLAFLLWRVRLRVALFGLAWMLLTPLVFVFFSPPTDRYFYLPSIGYAMFIASILVDLPRLLSKWAPSLYRPARLVAALLALTLLLAEVVPLLNKEAAWRLAGEESRAVFRDTQQIAPDPRDYTAFFYIDLPPTINGVPTFGNGLQEAVQLLYDNPTLVASSTTCDQLLAQQELPRYLYLLRYNGNGVALLPDKTACR
jgi:hypothetical protein